jgi:serine/threonine protein kinase
MNLREPDFEPIPGYRLIEPIGSGGFGEVWKCEAPGGLYKAIKFVYGNLHSLDVEGARAEQERTALDRVKEVRHPFVLSLERIEEVEGELVIVMELAEKSLHDLYVECQSAGLVGIPRDDLLRYMRDTAEGLDYMNEKHNLQHLDVKPRNLFIQGDRVKVADFGLVKHLERSSASGILGAVTPLYAPPETFTGKISGRSDQYSLAVVYHELLTGTRPFNGKNVRVLAQQHMQEEPDVRAVPEAERPVVLRALSKDPAKRFPNCLAFLRALHAARSETRPDSVVLDSAGDNRPRSICDTMEDVFLEQADHSDASVDLGGPAVRGDEDEVSKLGITIAQPQTGALRPTLVLGVGALGRRALLELRCRFLDRFGDLNKLPLLRFLYIDCDAEAVKAAVRGSPEVALQPHEVYHLSLQPVAHYRRRHLDHLGDWLPREKLYALPRSLTPQGSRALGRLAFADNYLRLLARLRKEIQQSAHPDALYQTVDRTGLALRDNVPRVYVVAGAGGGGSGYLVDLGYAVRRLLKQMRHSESPVTAFLLCGAPDDPATPGTELANVYATLTELNHFADPAIRFTAQYGADGPSIAEGGTTFDAVYVLTQANRSPEARREGVSHLGSYLFHELTTPLGPRLDRGRHGRPPADATPFRSLGTYGVWFPRGLMLRLAGRDACKRLLEEWQGAGEPTATAEVEAACARVLADPDLRAETLTARLEAEARDLLDGSTPAEALTRLLAGLEEQAQQAVAQDDPGNWAKQAVTRVREWSGAGLSAGPVREAGEWRKSRLSRALEGAAQKLAAEWGQRLSEAAFGLMEHPGRRVAAAEAALARFVRFCSETADANAALLAQQSARARQAQQHLEAALTDCVVGAGGFSFFGGKNRRLLRVFMDHLAAYARQCLVEDLGAALQQFLAALDGKLHEGLRDLSFCRQRLRHLQVTLESADDGDTGETAHAIEASPNSPMPSTESFWDAIRQSATTRVVLPGGETDLDRAARRFLASLGVAEWGALDQALQDGVLGPLGGLHRACTSSADLMRGVAAPLLEQAAECLGSHLPVTDVAQVEFALAQTTAGDVGRQAEGYYRSAAPVVCSRTGEGQASFLLIPAGESGKAYAEAAQRVVTELQVVRVPGQADLMFCREQGPLGLDDLERLLKPCRAAYEETAPVPQVSPHARFDILDWMPLAT